MADYNDFSDEELIALADDGSFVCGECENEGKPQVGGEDGMVNVDVQSVKQKFADGDKSVAYMVASCPTCGMEYKFVEMGDDLKLKASDEEK